MSIVIIGFGVLIMFAGAAMIASPANVGPTLRGIADQPGTHIAAVLVRLILGAVLILFADASKFPVVIRFLGWVAVIAAIVLTLIGRRRFIALMNWAVTLIDPYLRLAGTIAAIFGAFLAYAFI